MTIKILMPALSPTMTEGRIKNWLVKLGDIVKAGDIIAEIETDKATMEVESVDEGTITHLIKSDKNKLIPVNSVIALINGKEDESLENNSEETTLTKDESTDPINSNHKLIKDIQNNNDDDNARIIASPFVKFFSHKNNVDLKNIQGSGPEGRIIKRDIIKLKSRDEALKIMRDHKIVEPSSIRSIIAKKTTETKRNVPHFYLSINSNVEKLISLRNKINESIDFKISFNDLIVKAMAMAIQKNSKTNVSWIDGKIYQYSSIDISIAVALKEGLMTPIIKDADKKGILEISKEIKNLIQKANSNQLLPEEYTGGSISITNLGMYGISDFSAIINQPQSLILAVGAIEKIPVVENGKVEVGNVLKSTLSVDHRALDGAVAAKLLHDFNNIIENPFEIWLNSNDLEII